MGSEGADFWGAFPETGGGNDGGAGGNGFPILIERPLLGWLGVGWGYAKTFCSSNGSSLTLGGFGLTAVSSGDVEATFVELTTGLVSVVAEVVD